jgi:hypothetical protein
MPTRKQQQPQNRIDAFHQSTTLCDAPGCKNIAIEIGISGPFLGVETAFGQKSGVVRKFWYLVVRRRSKTPVRHAFVCRIVAP